MRKLALALCSLALLLGACASMPRYGAAGDIHAFLVAIRDGDNAAFDAHVDRPALKEQLRSRLIAEQGRAHGTGSWQAIGAALVGPLVDVGVDAFVRPDVFRAIAIEHGYSPDRPLPNRFVIASALRPLDSDRVCVVARRDGPCTLVFKDEGGTWKLIGYEGDLKRLKL